MSTREHRLRTVTTGFTVDHVAGIGYDHETTVEVENGVTRVTIRDVRHLLDPIVIETDDPAVSVYRLREYLAYQNIAAQLRALPERQRRAKVEAMVRQAHLDVAIAPPCVECNGTGWIDDDTEGRGYSCPACASAED